MDERARRDAELLRELGPLPLVSEVFNGVSRLDLVERAERAERELRAVQAGVRFVIDAAATAVLLSDSQLQLAMTWGAELADALRLERRCHELEVRNLRAGIDLSPPMLPARDGPPWCEFCVGTASGLAAATCLSANRRFAACDRCCDHRAVDLCKPVEAAPREAPPHHAWNDAMGIWFCDTEGCTEHLRGERR